MRSRRLQKVKSTREELAAKPCQLQGFNLKVTKCEKYLGMYLCTGSYTQSLNRNIKAKCEKMLVAAQAIRLICSNPGVKVVRKLKAQKLLIMSQVSPCRTGSECQMPSMEQGFKRAITTILPNNTNYEALLRQVNNIHVLTMVCV